MNGERTNRLRMGNLQKHAGPLSDKWHQSQLLLAKQIIQRMTDLGIIPVLPAFTGFMPRAAPTYSHDPHVGFSNDSCALDVSLRPNSIIHPIGSDSAAMNPGQLFLISLMTTMDTSSSLPYLDPTDPFFQTVGADLLNEVKSIFLFSLSD